eukprot:TRINITY_DN33430_c0_g1_i1.p2 TRINITY_DN33430_c0_g1~~TRINITY_DN33430_c0_g1_i1.p2  ORF type:complete len:111 (-),score=37.65 TRINITY_DN33430_c0_g1_i1:65-397(-)
MMRFVAAALLLLSTPSLAVDKEKCGEEIESKVGGLMKQKNLEVGQMLKHHDVNSDDHISEDEVKLLFKQAGVIDECLSFATDSLEHLVSMHDHDGNGKLTHDEANRHKEL